MTKFVPYLSVEQIERDVDALLAEFAQARGVVVTPPVPIEDIVEKHLKLGIEFDDLHRIFGIPRDCDGSADILGAIYFDQRQIVIDESLDPEEYPRTEGRYRLTLAHEAGHWRLHRHLLVKDPAQAPLVLRGASQAYSRIEWQAYRYASCLLMPRSLVIAAWHERFGNTNPHALRHKFSLPASLDTDAQDFWSFRQKHDDWALNQFALVFAQKFRVSMEAMRIRLEQIGLLRREIPRQRSFGTAI
jgi:Zn-dependent peptidase ImmA (M78 family)